MKVSKELALELLEMCKGEEPLEGFSFVHDSGWEDSGKYQDREVIFKHSSGKYYSLCESRSGSYFSDYHYSSEDFGAEVELTQVKPVEKTVITYERVK